MTTVAVAGAGGAQGLACLGYLRAGLPDARLVALDRWFSEPALQELSRLDASSRLVDLLAQRVDLVSLLREVDVVVNLAGPFYVLGSAVLDAAIEAGIDYVDICDDVDATGLLLERHEDARRRGTAALVNMGSAPGTTNVLVRLALDHLQRLAPTDAPRNADIAWCAPDSDLTSAIFAHLVHCFRTALPGRNLVPAWEELDPRSIAFPAPVGDVEVVRLGHPEPLTLARYAACPTVLRGGMTSSGLLRRAWALARLCDQGLALPEAWREMSAGLPPSSDEPGWSGMCIDVTVGERGLRFESATTISMEQSTAVPAAAGVLMLMEDAGPGPGVWAPEVMDPRRFFEQANRVSPGGGGLKAYELRTDGSRGDRVPLRELFSAGSDGS